MSTLHQRARPRGQIPVGFHAEHVRLNPSTCACARSKNQISTQSRRAADAAGVNQPTDRNRLTDCSENKLSQKQLSQWIRAKKKA